MRTSDIAMDRLRSQQIAAGTDLKSPREVMAFMGALQAQDYAGAKWSIGLRLPGSTDSAVEQALADRTIVRTWALRGTLHFVAPADIHWLLALVAPHVIAGNSRRYRELGLDSLTFARSNEVLMHALENGKQLDRPALRTILEEEGVRTEGQRLPYILQRASLDGLICQIGLRRNNPLFVKLGEWLPETRILGRDASIEELATRYFSSRGPATLNDFIWWSGLPAAAARVGIESVKSQFNRETIDGQTYWGPRYPAGGGETSQTGFLLPGFDEYLLSYKDRSASLDRAGGTLPAPRNGAPVPTMVVRGQVIGTWKRTFGKQSVAVVPHPFTRLTDDEDLAFSDAARRYGEFLGLRAVWNKGL